MSREECACRGFRTNACATAMESCGKKHRSELFSRAAGQLLRVLNRVRGWHRRWPFPTLAPPARTRSVPCIRYQMRVLPHPMRMRVRLHQQGKRTRTASEWNATRFSSSTTPATTQLSNRAKSASTHFVSIWPLHSGRLLITTPQRLRTEPTTSKDARAHLSLGMCARMHDTIHIEVEIIKLFAIRVWLGRVHGLQRWSE